MDTIIITDIDDKLLFHGLEDDPWIKDILKQYKELRRYTYWAGLISIIVERRLEEGG